jgi:hypothetical protein
MSKIVIDDRAVLDRRRRCGPPGSRVDGISWPACVPFIWTRTAEAILAVADQHTDSVTDH